MFLSVNIWGRITSYERGYGVLYVTELCDMALIRELPFLESFAHCKLKMTLYKLFLFPKRHS